MIQELQDGWSIIDSLVYHCVALGFLFFFLAPIVVQSYMGIHNGPDYFWGFIICCLIKLGSLLNRRMYRHRVERTNEYLACIHDPQRKFVGNFYPRNKTRPAGGDLRWTFNKEPGP